ncbi:MAG: pyridoxamine 5'-phosphate oxidase family protein [Aliidongia sp.]
MSATSSTASPMSRPTAHWRHGNRVFWHGSAASRMLEHQAEGHEVCLTVTHVDGFVLARSGFHHSINYRSVMAFGRAEPVRGEDEKRAALDGFIERLFPAGPESCAVTKQELKGTLVLSLDLTEASAKIRTGPPKDDEEDYASPVWAGVLPLHPATGGAGCRIRFWRQALPSPPICRALHSPGKS